MKTAVILAAGESSRFWPLNSKHKSLFYLMGRPLIWWTLFGVQKVSIKRVIIVQSPKRDIEKELKNFSFPKLKIGYAVQAKPLGTGNALWCAKNLLKENFFVLNGDVVCSEKILKPTIEKIKKEKCPCLAAQRTKFPWLFGMLKLKKDEILKVVEKPKKGKEPSFWKVVGVYYLTLDYFSFYEKVKKHPFDFEDALNLYFKKKKVKAVFLKDSEEDLPAFLKYPWHLFAVKNYLFKNFLKERISQNVSISKQVLLEGKVWIEEGTKIFERATIKGPCYIGENCVVGSNSLLRDGVNLERDCVVGAFCEVKNTIFQKGCTTHSGYLGDSIFGQNVKIGAGIITSNVRMDGKEIFCEVKGQKVNTFLKHFGTCVGENTFLGSNVNVMPGKFIGKACQIFPNSLVKENIKDHTTLKFNY